MSSWYIVKDGQRVGPMGREELEARVAEGAVTGGTLVWRPGMAGWAEAGSVPELGLPPPLPPSPPPLPPSPAPSRSWQEAPAPDVARRPEFAGFGVRLAAKLLDGLLLYGPALLVERLVVTLAFDGVTPAPPNWDGVLRLLLYFWSLNTAIAVAYTAYFIARHEGTPGKRLLGLRVVRADGGRVGALRAIGRYFAEGISAAVFFAGYVMSIFDEEKRTLHDYLCDTRVVKGPREEPATAPE